MNLLRILDLALTCGATFAATFFFLRARYWKKKFRDLQAVKMMEFGAGFGRTFGASMGKSMGETLHRLLTGQEHWPDEIEEKK